MPVLMRNRTCQEKRGTRVTEFASMDLVCIGNRLGVSGAHWMQLLPQFVAFKVPYGCGTEGRRQFAQCCVLLLRTVMSLLIFAATSIDFRPQVKLQKGCRATDEPLAPSVSQCQIRSRPRKLQLQHFYRSYHHAISVR